MGEHVCPWWGGYFIDNRLRRLLHKPEKILGDLIQPGMTVLDFGCGMGGFSLALAHMVGEQGSVIAADLQPQMLRAVQRRAEKAQLADKIRTHECRRDTIGIEVPVDFVLAFWSAHEVPDQRRLFVEIHDCLVLCGEMLVVEPRGHVSGRKFQQMLDTANDIGLTLRERRPVRLSRSAVLTKRP